MEVGVPTIDYFIWGIDDSPYGPVSLPVLLDWINEGFVLPETWVFTHRAGTWIKAAEVPELAHRFKTAGEDLSSMLSPMNFKPATLRRVKILADLKDAQLAHLAEYLEYQEYPHQSLAVKRGDLSDAMYLVIQGEFRSRTLVGGRETILATHELGGYFGEMAMFDPIPRPADVVANLDSAALRLSVINFERLTHEAPTLITPFLGAVSQSLAGRSRGSQRHASRALTGSPGRKTR